MIDRAQRSQPRSGRRARGGAGFTLLEVLLAIALIAVAGSLFLVSLETLGRSSPADEFEGAFWRAMAQGRERALASRRTVELRWDEEARVFVVGSGESAAVIRIESKETTERFAARFTEEVAANDFILVRGELVTRRATPAVRFFPDGTCQSFGVELAFGENSRRRLIIDPWTGAETLSGDAAEKGGHR